MIINEIWAKQSIKLNVTAAVKKVEFIYQWKNLSLYELYKLLCKFNKNHYMRKNSKL